MGIPICGRVRDLSYIRDSKTKEKNEIYMIFSAKDKIMHVGTSEGRKVITRKEEQMFNN